MPNANACCASPFRHIERNVKDQPNVHYGEDKESKATAAMRNST